MTREEIKHKMEQALRLANDKEHAERLIKEALRGERYLGPSLMFSFEDQLRLAQIRHSDFGDIETDNVSVPKFDDDLTVID